MTFHILHRSGWIGTGDRPSQKQEYDSDKILYPPGIEVFNEHGENVNTDAPDPEMFNEDWWDSRGLLMPPEIRWEALRRRQK